MPEDRKRPATFSQALSQTKIASDQAISRIADWAGDLQDKLNDSADALAKESEDKGFWGKAFTFGTTIGCIALEMAGPGMCTVAGAVVGAATRAITDATGDAEGKIPTDVKAPEHMKYYKDKIADIAEDVNRASDKLESFNANEWKTDLLKQIGDSYSAYKMGTGLEKAGAFDGLRDSTTQAPIESLTPFQEMVINQPLTGGITNEEMSKMLLGDGNTLLGDLGMGEMMYAEGLGVSGSTGTELSLGDSFMGKEMMNIRDVGSYDDLFETIAPDDIPFTESISQAVLPTSGTGSFLPPSQSFMEYQDRGGELGYDAWDAYLQSTGDQQAAPLTLYELFGIQKPLIRLHHMPGVK